MAPAQPTATSIRAALRAHATPERAAASARYFKTGKGEYAEGDVFVGVGLPEIRRIARDAREAPLAELDRLLRSKVHEERLTALIVLALKFRRSKNEAQRREIFELYVRRIEFVNNWDLVDTSAPEIVGGWLLDRDRKVLVRLAKSPHLWSRRTAMVATYRFIRAGQSADALRIAEILLRDPHDLIHKAAGWMLREVGQRVDLAQLRGFLEEHVSIMPRTMLRYAIERLPEAERKRWMAAPRATAERPIRASAKTARR